MARSLRRLGIVLVPLVACRAPAPPAPPSFRAPSSALAQELPPTLPGSAEPWTLAQLLSEIERANPTLAVAEANLAEARAAQREARATRWPELTFAAGYVATDEPAQAFGLLLDQRELTLGPGFDATPGTIENWRTGLRVDWPLFVPGWSQGVAAAEAGLAASELAREAAARRVLNAGVQAWLGLAAARALARVAAESVTVVEQRLAITRTRSTPVTASTMCRSLWS